MALDLFISEIVKEAKLTEEPYGVEIFKDCSYKLISLNDHLLNIKKNEENIPQKRNSTKEHDLPTKKSKNEEIIDLD